MKRRTTAALLALVMLLASLPFADIKTVYSNAQQPVKIITSFTQKITPSGQKYVYDFTIEWAEPKNLAPESPPDTSTSPQAVDYNIHWKNISKSEKYANYFPEALIGPVSSVQLTPGQNSQPKMENSSLYFFKVWPHHTHLVWSGDTAVREEVFPTGAFRPGADARSDSDKDSKQILYLTDIDIISATAQIDPSKPISSNGTFDTKLTVTWTNPLRGEASDIFTGWKFTYAPNVGSSIVSDANLDTNVNTQVVISSKQATATGNNVTATFDAPSLNIGYSYSIMVEPLYGGTIGADGTLTGTYEEARAQKASFKTITVAKGNYVGEYDLYYSIASKSPAQRYLYRYNSMMIQPPLDGYSVGSDKLKLYWNAVSKMGSVVTSIILYKTPGSPDPQIILGTGGATSGIWEYITDLPKVKTTFYYDLHYRLADGTTGVIRSVEFVFNPFEPTFGPNIPTIFEANANPADETKPLSGINLTWEAFYRSPLNADEQALVDIDAANGLAPSLRDKFVDTNVFYDLWITDDLTNFNRDGFDSFTSASNIDPSSLDPWYMYTPNPPNQEQVPVYQFNEAKNYAYYSNNSFQMKALEDNKIYYIRVRVTRNTDKHEYAEAYYALYIPPRGDIRTRPYMMNKPPLKIKQVDGVEQITKESITIEWRNIWSEAFNQADGKWYAEVAVVDNGKLYFGDDITDTMRKNNQVIDISVFDDRGAAAAALTTAGADTSLLPIRVMDISATQPRLHVVKKENIDAVGGYDIYVRSVLKAYNGETDAELSNFWKTITPTPANPVGNALIEYTVTADWQNKKLEPNTPYVIIYRPFLTAPELIAYLPNYVVGTTLSDLPPILIQPTVPILVGVSSTDTTVTVKWTYHDSYEYILSFSELLSDYRENGLKVEWDTIKKSAHQEKDAEGKMWWVYTVPKLFPETIYYFWVRAVVKNETQTLMSDWSNPIMMQTKEMMPPDPPKGLGLASSGNLDIINKEQGVALKSIDKDYMILEWLLDSEDTVLPEGIEGTFTGGEGDNPYSPNITVVYLARYLGLLPNKPYYVRAKTRLTIAKDDNPDNLTGISFYYQYVVQMSLSPEFTDIIEVVIPSDDDAAGDDVRKIMKESAWTVTYRFVTGKTNEEYDGDKNDNMYPLPPDDFEVTYEDGTLNVRFRSNGTDANGNRDNLTDQRLITKLIQEKTYDYVIDLSVYGEKKIKNRVLSIPYSLLKTFDERGITVTIKSDKSSFALAPGFFKTTTVNALADKGYNSKVQLKLLTETTFPAEGNRASYINAPQKMEMNFTTPKADVNIQNMAKPMDVSLKVANREVAYDNNIDGYLAENKENSTWDRQNAQYDAAKGELSFKTAKVASYSAIAATAPLSTQSDNAAAQSSAALQTKMNIQGINYFYPQAEISASQLNKLISALANGTRDVNLSESLTAAEKTSLVKAGMFLDGTTTVSREKGLDALVKLYELKTKRQIKGYPTNSGLNDFAEVPAPYKTTFLKAEYLGLVSSDARPKSNLTIAEALEFIDAIILDSGM